MKKFIIFNSLVVFIFLLLFVNIEDVSSFSVNWIIIPMFIPIAAGLITALSQNKKRSYDYFPAILAGSIFFSLVSAFFYNLIIYFTWHPGIPFHIQATLLYSSGPNMIFGLAAMYFVGGLFGIAMKGVKQNFLQNKIFKLNLNISFLKSFLIGAVFLLAANIYYVLISIPPDWGWKFEIPVTSFFIVLYLVIFFFVSKKLIKNPENNYLLWAYNVFLSLVFLSNAIAVQVAFQNVNWQYWRYVSTAPYLVILGLGLICYISLALYLEKIKTKFID
jgi:hypothetical protein